MKGNFFGIFFEIVLLVYQTIQLDAKKIIDTVVTDKTYNKTSNSSLPK